MNITLSPDHARIVASRVASGQYSSAEDVVNSALLVLISHEAIEQDQALELEALRAELQVSEEELERGDVVDGEEMFAELRERGRLMRQAAA